MDVRFIRNALVNVTVLALTVGPALSEGEGWTQTQADVSNPAVTATESRYCPVSAVPTAKRSPIHSKDPMTVAGLYYITDEALAVTYRGAPRDKLFGYTLVVGDKELYVRDMQYDLGDGKFGIRPIPVSDNRTVIGPDGREVPGHVVMDDFLRKQMGLGENDPIFALISYNHPEQFKGDLKTAAYDHVRTEMGQTHQGAYLGKGETSNWPIEYHQKKWENKGYPATVQLVSMEGTDQAALNLNCQQWERILNHDGKFPQDYKNDPFKTPTTHDTLRFAKGWVEGDAELRNDPSWWLYCAEGQKVTLNTCLNVPLNEASFKKTWGDQDGVAFFEKTKAAYRSATGKDLVAVDSQKFGKPLYERERLASPLDAKRPGQAMVWGPQATSDLLVNFVEVYVPFVEAGGIMQAASILGFKEEIEKRMGLGLPEWRERFHRALTSVPTAGFSDDAFLKIAVPVINKIQIADALALSGGIRTPEALADFLQKRTVELFVAFGGPMDLLPTVLESRKEDGGVDPAKLAAAGIPPDAIKKIAGAWRLAVASTSSLKDPATGKMILECSGVSRVQAWSWLREAIRSDIAAARDVPVAEGKVRWYVPPADAHRVALGLHPKNPHITVREVGTAFDGSELKLKQP